MLAVSIVASLTVIACGSSPAAPTPSATTSTTTTPTPTPAPPSPAPATTAPDGTLLLEGLPVDLSQLNYSDIVARREGRDPEWLPLDDFGRLLPVSSARPVSMPNPQPTFYAPLGTPVYAVVTGVVSQIPTLYSRDYSVMISSGERGGVWEHEHIMNVTVRVGDRVTAGQRIGEVSDYECTWSRNSLASDPLCQSRLGLVEIGLLYGGAAPQHRCPFEAELIAPSKKDGIFAQLDSARSRIKAAFGDAGKYQESTWATPQCISLSRVEG